jgi:N-acetyl-gamma-glutamyl-phosphate reductase
MTDAPFKIAILGASGYTGAELVRLIANHPWMKIEALTADRKAGMTMAEVFPHLGHLNLPPLQRIEDLDFSGLDLIFCALPHGATQELVSSLPETVKVVDLSADFRLRDPAEYKKWYGLDHTALELQKTAVYGLPEFYRDEIAGARLVANTGCYVATSLLAVLPLLQAGVIDAEDIVIDAKSGVSGAGRAAKEAMLFTEVSEGFSAYGVGGHRHMGELDQEFSKAAGRPVLCAFTPHLIPINRAIFATIYVKGDADAIHQTLTAKYSDEPFIHVRAKGTASRSHEVRGSNLCHIGVVPDRRPGRSIIISTLDNLMKGASGQALQNANLMLGLPETMGLEAAPLFP